MVPFRAKIVHVVHSSATHGLESASEHSFSTPSWNSGHVRITKIQLKKNASTAAHALADVRIGIVLASQSSSKEHRIAPHLQFSCCE